MMIARTRVIVESPFKGDVEINTAYLHALMRFCFARGEAPFASHELYTRCLDDSVPEERAAGIQAGLLWGEGAVKSVVGVDLGISEGMRLGIQAAREAQREIEFVSLGSWRREASPLAILRSLQGVRSLRDTLTIQVANSEPAQGFNPVAQVP